MKLLSGVCKLVLITIVFSQLNKEKSYIVSVNLKPLISAVYVVFFKPSLALAQIILRLFMHFMQMFRNNVNHGLYVEINCHSLAEVTYVFSR